MTDKIIKLDLTIQAEDQVELEEMARLTTQLRNEILRLDVQDATLVRAEDIPEGAKSGDAVTWGQIIIALVASGGVFTTLITLLDAWLTRHERYSIILEIDGDKLEITGISTEEQKRLIDEWLYRHPIILQTK